MYIDIQIKAELKCNCRVVCLTSFIPCSTGWVSLNSVIILFQFLALLRCSHLLLTSFPASLSVLNTELQTCETHLL